MGPTEEPPPGRSHYGHLGGEARGWLWGAGGPLLPSCLFQGSQSLQGKRLFNACCSQPNTITSQVLSGPFLSQGLGQASLSG